MQKFNTTDIFTGYLKQLLHNFNLPKIKVYTREQQEYFEENGVERFDVLETITADKNPAVKAGWDWPEHMRYIPYIKDGKLQEYINGEWVNVGKRNTDIGEHFHLYEYGNKLLNYTKTLKIKDNVYDSYTHEYLGDYLRFHRDYTGIDLMPLYNCFSNRSCERLKIKAKYSTPEYYSKASYIDLPNFKTTSDYVGKYIVQDEQYVEVTEENKDDLGIITYDDVIDSQLQTWPYTYCPASTGEFIFNSTDKNYKIYMIPVKLFKTYTIAIDSTLPVEFCCGIFGDYQDTRKKFENIPGLTYKHVKNCMFTQPFLYTELLNLNQLTLADSIVELAQNECDLKLFIKLPIDNNSTIVVLEGDYLNWNDTTYSKPAMVIKDIYNYGTTAPIGIPTAEEDGKLYLNTATKMIYIANHEMQRWDFAGPIDSFAGTGNRNKVTNLIIDSETYGENVQVEDYFEYYKMNADDPTLVPSTAYFNTGLSPYKLFINPVKEWRKTTNNSVINLNAITDKKDITFITPLQLLRLNTQEQHPFADRLIEYLTGNAISDMPDEIPDNIKRAQKILELNEPSNGYYAPFAGLWDYKMNKIIYDYINRNCNNYQVNHDILGYVDKDVEKNYAYTKVALVTDPVTKKTVKKRLSTSILNAELTEEEK